MGPSDRGRARDDGPEGPFVTGRAPGAPVVDEAGEVAYAAVPVIEEASGTTAASLSLTVVALDVETGDEIWSVEAAAPEADESLDSALARVVGVSADAVVVTSQLGSSPEEVGPGTLTTAFDPASGDELWSQDGFAAMSQQEEVVVGHVLERVDVSGTGESQLVLARGVDLATGEERWTYGEEASSLRVRHGGPGLVMVVQSPRVGSDGDEMVTLDPATGEASTPLVLGTNVYTEVGCTYDQESASVCVAGPLVVGFTTATAEQAWAIPSDDDPDRLVPSVHVAFHGLVYVSVEGEPLTLDAATGADAEDPGLVPQWVSTYAAVAITDGQAMAYPVAG